MKFDLHTHHERCGHAAGAVRDYVEEAVKLGLSMIGISDHAPYFADEADHSHPRTAMAKSEFPNYVKEVLQLKEEYKDRTQVLLGIESDFFPEHAELYRQIYSEYPFDYIIGSVHHSNGKNIFLRGRFDGLSEEELVREKEIYLDLIRQSARSGVFDILGHIDAIKRNFMYLAEIRTDAVEQTIKALGECNATIELNTSGKHEGKRSWYPREDILELANHYGLGITFGSDSHSPQRVADEWEQARTLLKETGFKQWTIFKQRKRYTVPL